jgi:hypothetical protein
VHVALEYHLDLPLRRSLETSHHRRSVVGAASETQGYPTVEWPVDDDDNNNNNNNNNNNT